MHQMAIDVENGGAIVFSVNDVLVPKLVVQSATECCVACASHAINSLAILNSIRRVGQGSKQNARRRCHPAGVLRGTDLAL
jgi:hypothetical protein